MDILNEVRKIKEKMPYFLEHQRGKKSPGYFQYSYSGDRWGEDIHWNVGSSVFAVKIAYMIGMPINEDMVQEALCYIKSFQHLTGYIYDDRVYRKGQLSTIKSQIKRKKIYDLNNNAYIRAESRQCFSALRAYNTLPDLFPKKELIPLGKLDSYLHKFDWNQPWSAGSHYSHLLFYLTVGYNIGILSKEDYEQRINFLKRWIDDIQNPKTGSWYYGEVSSQQAINGAMKILTGFRITEELCINEETGQKLIDLCLRNVNDEQACDNFNIIYVLMNAAVAAPNYRTNEIVEFAEKRFEYYLEYYYPQYGGFSFYKNQSNSIYYGCRIAKGLDEPDMHGTTLFLWGIAIICKILKIDKELGLYEMIP